MKRIGTFLLAMVLTIVMTGCSGGGGQGGSGSSKDESAPMHFEISGGILDYDSYEYVGKGFYSSGDGDPSKTICINFNYTNKENTQKRYSNDFWVKAYQNGTELKSPSGYTTSGSPESMQRNMDSVLQNGVLNIGLGFVLQDYSPVTVIARHNGGKEESTPMVLAIEPYEDHSFDIDRLYGYWQGKGDQVLMITSSRITWKKTSSSSTYRDDPSMWTDETTFHSTISDLDPLTIDDSGDALKLSNGEYVFTQKENWSEADASGGEPVTVAIGETISVDFAELRFDKKGVSNKIEYSSTTGSGGGYGGNITRRIIIENEKAGTKYIYLEGTIRNTSSISYDPEDMKATVVINDTYTLEAKVSAIDGGSSVSSLNPLNSCMIVLDAGVDTKTAGEIKKLDWYIGFDHAFSGSSRGEPADSRYYYCITVE